MVPAVSMDGRLTSSCATFVVIINILIRLINKMASNNLGTDYHLWLQNILYCAFLRLQNGRKVDGN